MSPSLDFVQLRSQLDSLQEDDLMFEFICEQTFENYARKPGGAGNFGASAAPQFLTLPQIAPLLENLLRAQGVEPNYREVHCAWQRVCDRDGHCMRFPAFVHFVRSTLATLSALLATAAAAAQENQVQEDHFCVYKQDAEQEDREPQGREGKHGGEQRRSAREDDRSSSSWEEKKQHHDRSSPGGAHLRSSSSTNMIKEKLHQGIAPRDAAFAGNRGLERQSLDLESLTSEISHRVSTEMLERHKRETQRWKMAHLAKPKSKSSEKLMAGKNEVASSSSSSSTGNASGQHKSHRSGSMSKAGGAETPARRSTGSRTPTGSKTPRDFGSKGSKDSNKLSGTTQNNVGDNRMKEQPQASAEENSGVVFRNHEQGQQKMKNNAASDAPTSSSTTSGATSSSRPGSATRRVPPRNGNPSRLLREFDRPQAEENINNTQEHGEQRGASSSTAHTSGSSSTTKMLSPAQVQDDDSHLYMRIEDALLAGARQPVSLEIPKETQAVRDRMRALRGATTQHCEDEVSKVLRQIRSALDTTGESVFCDPDFDCNDPKNLGLPELAVPSSTAGGETKIRWRRLKLPGSKLQPGLSSSSTSTTTPGNIEDQNNTAGVAGSMTYWREACCGTNQGAQLLRTSSVLGDSWLTGAAGLVKQCLPERFLRAVLQPSLCDAKRGIFTFRFFKSGQQRFVMVDGYAPFFRTSGGSWLWQPWGADAVAVDGDKHTEDSAWWMYLLEKAYAKVFGSYARLMSGFPDEAIVDFLGCPVEKFTLAKKASIDGFWNEIRLAWNKHKAGAPSSGSSASSSSSSSRSLPSSSASSGPALLGCIKSESTASQSSSRAQSDPMTRFVHIEGEKLGLAPGLLNTGFLRNQMYAVVDLVQQPALNPDGTSAPSNVKPPRWVRVRPLMDISTSSSSSCTHPGRPGHQIFTTMSPLLRARCGASSSSCLLSASGTSGGGAGRGGRQSPLEDVMLRFEDWMLIFTNAFLLLAGSPLQITSTGAWTQENCGGTPIPIKKPVYGTPESWAKNPQFQITMPWSSNVGGDGSHASFTGATVELMVLLQQEDPRFESGTRFPFSSDLEEIFLCVLRKDGSLNRLPVFDKTAVVREGGMSLIVHRRDVLLKVQLKPGETYVLVPSTWRTEQAKKFHLTLFAEDAIAVREL
ncbi:unnamed protein product [Amoebophrya sp. A25]|nr:unnamed protein product [Amoebophrya sp. A25]|eukprot:GSA25T00003065001.1